MTLFDKDSVCNLVSQTLNGVNTSPNKNTQGCPTQIYPVNADLFHWLQNRSNKDHNFNKIYEIFDTSHPEIGIILSPHMTQKVFDCRGPEAEVLSSMMSSVVRPRLFKNADMRDKARRVKSVSNVGMRKIYVIGENGYHNCPSNMIPLIRNSKYDKVDYDKFTSFGNDFSRFGLLELKAVVGKIIENMQNLDQNDVWLGFHRTKPELVASTLARYHNLEWSDIFHINCPLNKLPDFLVKPEILEQSGLIAENEAMANAVFLKTTAIRDKAKRDFKFVNLAYKPRMYPLHEFYPIPTNADKIISMLESMPELGGKPAFDYFWVVVPSFSMKHPAVFHQDGIFRVMLDGKLFETKSETEVSFKIDKKLVELGTIMPCIIGERDGKCYFICPWI